MELYAWYINDSVTIRVFVFIYLHFIHFKVLIIYFIKCACLVVTVLVEFYCMSMFCSHYANILLFALSIDHYHGKYQHNLCMCTKTHITTTISYRAVNNILNSNQLISINQMYHMMDSSIACFS